MQVREHLAVDSATGVSAVTVEVVLVEDGITLLACTFTYQLSKVTAWCLCSQASAHAGPEMALYCPETCFIRSIWIVNEHVGVCIRVRALLGGADALTLSAAANAVHIS